MLLYYHMTPSLTNHIPRKGTRGGKSGCLVCRKMVGVPSAPMPMLPGSPIPSDAGSEILLLAMDVLAGSVCDLLWTLGGGRSSGYSYTSSSSLSLSLKSSLKMVWRLSDADSISGGFGGGASKRKKKKQAHAKMKYYKIIKRHARLTYTTKQ